MSLILLFSLYWHEYVEKFPNLGQNIGFIQKQNRGRAPAPKNVLKDITKKWIAQNENADKQRIEKFDDTKE